MAQDFWQTQTVWDLDCSQGSANLLGKSLTIDLNETSEVFAQVKTVALKVKQQADGSDSTGKKKKNFLSTFSWTRVII